ncbi:AbrB/MazE/SpoVT family DNA-binding domain-containing protein [Priestia sp. Y58]|uniref:AbrB/MazE/SpoVT family DNA-binding domain-containing protein n=1 Tax=Priestia sp. Y58 TaxID=2922804 RepID=UPI0024077516|nr:AbrB/MazE/SpoVT family DNA-binding domain-containing protein [Priestia sp. Y58]MDG0032503.1 AbrB/MazE/SpoVT family DNA-binding domain-containing protein [Priestia sp. Y58]
MKKIGLIKGLGKFGRITFPSELRRSLGIKGSESHVEMSIENEAIIIGKCGESKPCAITGKVSDKNKVYLGNIVLSSEGEKILLQQLIDMKKQIE